MNAYQTGAAEKQISCHLNGGKMKKQGIVLRLMLILAIFLSNRILEAQSENPQQNIKAPKIEMILIPNGEYKEVFKTEETHVIPASFYIDKYEVTNANYKLFVDATGHEPPSHWENGAYPEGKGNHPVLVDWFDAQDYAKWAGKRLLSYAEWVAAAGDPKTKKSPWMEKLDRTEAKEKYRVFQPEKMLTEELVGFVSEVGTNTNDKSPLGICDLIGNALEWTSSSEIKDSEGSKEKQSLTIKLVGYFLLETAYMKDIAPLNAGPDSLFGFRCAKDKKKQE